MKALRTPMAIALLLMINSCATSPQNPTADATGAVVEAMTGSGMAGSVASAMVQNPALVDLLIQQLGVSAAQASGGAGSIFSLAQMVMSTGNFGLLSQAVPGMSKMLASAPPIDHNLLGGAGNGMAANGLMRMAALASSFQDLGMNSSMVGQFIPVVLQYLQDQGGANTMNLLQSALMR